VVALPQQYVSGVGRCPPLQRLAPIVQRGKEIRHGC
jgi:hypothetical protein